MRGLQAPFVTIFLELDEKDPYIDETASIIEEILKQRLQGVKNSDGVYVTPSFPKLIYVLDEHNCLRGGRFDYLTHLAAKCTIKRSYPDYISAKVMREQFDGEVFSCMGCVDGSEVITYKFEDKVYCESFERAWYRMKDVFNAVPQTEGSKNWYIDTNGVEIWDNSKNLFVPCYRFIRNIQDTWYRIKLSNGRFITVTDNHPFEIKDKGVVLARDLVLNDEILIDKLSSFCNGVEEPFTERVVWLLGLVLYSNNSPTSLNISLGLDEMDIQEHILDILSNDFAMHPNVVEQRKGTKASYNDIRVKSTELSTSGLRAYIEQFEGIVKDSRHIPNIIWNCTKELRLSFLGGLIDAIGFVNISDKVAKITFILTNYELSLQIMLLAQSVGFPASIYPSHRSKEHPNRTNWVVEFSAGKELESYMFCEKKLDMLPDNYGVVNADCSADCSNITSIEVISNAKDYSYDVTTESEHFTVSGIYSHNCRSFLSPWKKTDWYCKMMGEPESEIGKYQWEGRFNQGVVTINLPQIGIIADHDMDAFWSLLDERLAKCYKALLLRHRLLEGTKASTSPLHWQNGGIARLDRDDTIDILLHDGFSTLSLGYIGIYETVQAMMGVSHTTPEGEKFALQIMHRLANACEIWKSETGLGFGLYGTPAEALCYKFAKYDAEKYGTIPNVTDHGFYTNSYHVFVGEEINAFDKFAFEAKFQPISSGGCISYVEIPNLEKNQPVVEKLITFIYDNVRYGEFNSKSDYCFKCGFQGQINLNDNDNWECPCCGNTDMKSMYVSRRTCGYLGSNEWNLGKRKEMKIRFEHL